MIRQPPCIRRAATAGLLVAALLVTGCAAEPADPAPSADSASEGARVWNTLGQTRRDLATAQSDLAQEAAVRRRQLDLDADDGALSEARSQVRALTDRREELVETLQTSALMTSADLAERWREWRAQAARLEQFRDTYYADLPPLQDALALCEPLTAEAGRPAPGQTLRDYARRVERRVAPLVSRCLARLDSLSRSANPEIADYATRLDASHRERAEMRRRLASGEADPRSARRVYTAWARDFNALRATFDPEPELEQLDDAAQWRALARQVRRVVAASGARREERSAGPYELD